MRDVTVRVEDWLNISLGDGDFGVGVDQFTIVAISVDDDPDENSRWAKAHDKTGKFRITGESVSYISVSVTISPEIVIASQPIELLARFCTSTIYRLENRPARVPKDFDYVRCAQAISKALAVYGHPVA